MRDAVAEAQAEAGKPAPDVRKVGKALAIIKDLGMRAGGSAIATGIVEEVKARGSEPNQLEREAAANDPLQTPMMSAAWQSDPGYVSVTTAPASLGGNRGDSAAR